MSFVVDLDPKMNMLKLISKYPAMVDNIQVYSDEKNINYARGCPSAYK